MATPTFTTAGSLDEFLAGAEAREPFLTADSKSGARFERIRIDGAPYVLKHLHVDEDWIMRSSGDLVCRPVRLFQSRLLDRLPSSIEHAVVGVALGEGRNGWGGALLMRDVSTALVPEGDAAVPLRQHLGFLGHMAELHATYWGWQDTLELLPPIHRLLEFRPEHMSLEAARPAPDVVPPLVLQGWQRFAGLDGCTGAIGELVDDPTPLAEALESCPQCLLHGDWKMGNLGSLPDGRTVLLDWAMTGQGCGTLELAWYLSLNAARLPQSKEDAIEAYRHGLEAYGVVTAGWWERALRLALLAGVVWFGWEKALGGAGPELDWWLVRAEEGLDFL